MCDIADPVAVDTVRSGCDEFRSSVRPTIRELYRDATGLKPALLTPVGVIVGPNGTEAISDIVVQVPEPPSFATLPVLLLLLAC